MITAKCGVLRFCCAGDGFVADVTAEELGRGRMEAFLRAMREVSSFRSLVFVFTDPRISLGRTTSTSLAPPCSTYLATDHGTLGFVRLEWSRG
jgi:hypothetical protein